MGTATVALGCYGYPQNCHYCCWVLRVPSKRLEFPHMGTICSTTVLGWYEYPQNSWHFDIQGRYEVILEYLTYPGTYRGTKVYFMCLTKRSTLCQADNTRSEPLLTNLVFWGSWGPHQSFLKKHFHFKETVIRVMMIHTLIAKHMPDHVLFRNDNHFNLSGVHTDPTKNIRGLKDLGWKLRCRFLAEI